MTARYAVFAALATAMLSAPASAPAAAIEVDQGCYVEKVSAIMVTGSGYTPNSTASVTLAGTTAGVSTDETGAFTASLKAPTTSLELPGVEPMTLTGTDDTTGAAATTAVNIS
jgi:hypothetical protein